jgi:16S rRNA (uracil1498-N3)-methyltransferase
MPAMPLLKAPYAPMRVPVPLREGESIKLDAGLLRSLALREVNVSEAFTLADSAGVYFRASLQDRGETSGRALVYERMPRSPEPLAQVTLVCAVLARQRMIAVCQKATELGVARIVPVLSAHSVQRGGIEHEKPWAWKGQCVKAARQCRRSSVPEVTDVLELRAALEGPLWREASARFALDDRSPVESDPFPPAEAPPRACEIALAVGPEGGWSDPERDLLARAGAVVLALGGRVLRAETAVFAGLAIVQHRVGDLRP